MPIKIPNDLPAVKTLNDENIFVMTETRAITQDIRPLKILLLNLMPKKIQTENQLLRYLSNTPLQVEIRLLQTESYKSKHTSLEHMEKFYSCFKDIKNEKFTPVIIRNGREPIEFSSFSSILSSNFSFAFSVSLINLFISVI